MPRLKVALRTPPPDNARPISRGGRPFTRGGAFPSAAFRRTSISSSSLSRTSRNRIRAEKSSSSQRSSGFRSRSDMSHLSERRGVVGGFPYPVRPLYGLFDSEHPPSKANAKGAA